MKIRKYRKDDIPILLAHIEAYMHESPNYKRLPFDRRKMERMLEGNLDNNQFFCMICVDNMDRVLGGMCAQIVQFLFSNEYVAADLLLLVDPKNRGSFAAHKLIMAYIEWARARRVKQIRLEQTSGIEPELFNRLALAEGFREMGQTFVIDV